ncbi:MAG: hypothetical protein ACE5DZ_02845 [Mariprofundus sp.]
MKKIFPWLGQAIFYALFMLLVASFSDAPAYSQMPPDQALIKLAFSHAAKRIVPCRKRTAEELAALPAHMRRKMDCPRERSPLHVELEIDGDVIYKSVTEPAGIAKDGRSSIYQRITLLAGTHKLRLRMSDDVHAEAFNYAFEQQVHMKAGQVLVIDFASESDGFFLR